MDNEYFLTANGELYHHGIKGQKWGIRRFQNKDGSLTKAGERRRAKLESEIEKLGGGNSDSGSGRSPRRKTINELTDDDLRAMTTRMNLERDFYNARNNLAAANPPKVSKGKKFVEGLMKDVVAPAVSNAGKAWLEKYLKDALGIDGKSTVQRVKEEYEIAEYRKRLKDLNEPKKSTKDYIKTLANMSDDERTLLKDVAGLQFYVNALESGKGAKPDKGNNKKKDDDDD